mgnify:CR=1 FL=1
MDGEASVGAEGEHMRDAESDKMEIKREEWSRRGFITVKDSARRKRDLLDTDVITAADTG